MRFIGFSNVICIYIFELLTRFHRFLSLVIACSNAPEVSTPSSKHEHHREPETNHRDAFVPVSHGRLKPLQSFSDERSLCKSLLAAVLQASKIR